MNSKIIEYKNDVQDKQEEDDYDEEDYGDEDKEENIKQEDIDEVPNQSINERDSKSKKTKNLIEFKSEDEKSALNELADS